MAFGSKSPPLRERRSHRREGVEALPAEELPVLELRVPTAHVVDHGVARDVRLRVSGVDAVGLPADDDAQFDLEVDLFDLRRAADGRARVRHGGGGLPEEERLVRDGFVLFLGVVSVVHPDADDLPRLGDGGEQANVGDRERGQCSLVDERPDVCPVAVVRDVL